MEVFILCKLLRPEEDCDFQAGEAVEYETGIGTLSAYVTSLRRIPVDARS